MEAGKHSLLHLHSRALTGRDMETILSMAGSDVRCVCDGQDVGRGPEALRKAMEPECSCVEPRVARVMDIDGEPMVVEYDVADKTPRAVLRIESRASRITECRIEHDRAVVDRLVGRAKPLL